MLVAQPTHQKKNVIFIHIRNPHLEYIVASAFLFSKHDPEAVAGGGFVGEPAVEPEVAPAAELVWQIYGSVPARRGFEAVNATLNVFNSL